MKKIMNIQKHTKFMIFLHEKEAFLQKISKDLFYFKNPLYCMYFIQKSTKFL